MCRQQPDELSGGGERGGGRVDIADLRSRVRLHHHQKPPSHLRLLLRLFHHHRHRRGREVLEHRTAFAGACALDDEVHGGGPLPDLRLSHRSLLRQRCQLERRLLCGWRFRCLQGNLYQQRLLQQEPDVGGRRRKIPVRPLGAVFMFTCRHSDYLDHQREAATERAVARTLRSQRSVEEGGSVDENADRNIDTFHRLSYSILFLHNSLRFTARGLDIRTASAETMASVLLAILAAVIVVRADLQTRWKRSRDHEIIAGPRQVVHPVTSHLTPISCAERCSSFNWCSAFVINYPAGTCELFEMNVMLLDFSSSPPDSSFELWKRANNDNFLNWCPVDEGFVLSQAAQFCFLVVDNITNNWIESRDECEKRGLTLVVPDTALKMSILINTIWFAIGRDSKVFYIGAARPISDLFGWWTGDVTMFDWITGSPIDKDILKPFWASGQPNNDNNKQHCLTVSGLLSHLLSDKCCSDDFYFVCEKHRQYQDLDPVFLFNRVRVGLWVLMRENEIITGTRQVVHQVTSDLSPLSCVLRCSSFAGCVAVVTNYPVGKCELMERNVTLLDISSSAPDTSFVHWEKENNDNFLNWCPVDDGFVLSPAAQFCFLVVDNITNNWTDNKLECEKRGLTLVVPDTSLKMKILLTAIWTTPGRESKIFHIGAARPISDLSGRWTGDAAMFDWISGSRIDKDFLKPFWASGQPNNDNDSQHCLTVAGNLNNLLNDKECFEDNYFICEKRLTMEGQVKVRAEHFDKVSMIGEGTFGKVFLVFKINGWDYGRLYAMKKAKKTEDRKRMDNLLNELKVLKSVREKRFLASLNYAFEDPTHLNFVFDFVNGGDLYTHVSRRGSLCESCVKFYVGELVLALRYLHKLGIVHRDVKLENILIDSSGHVILTDFGFSKFLSSCQIPSSESCGTLRYMAPEAIQAGGHGYPVDWWAVGVVSYELLTGHCPFTAHEDENENYFASIISAIRGSTPSYPSTFSKEDFYYVAPAMQQPPTQWAEPPYPHVLPCTSTLCGSCLSATRSSLGSLGLSITRCRELDMGLDVSSMQALRPRACKRVRFELDGARPSQDLTEVDQTKVHLDMMAKDQVSNKRCRVDHSFVREVLSFPREVL
ncbi:hypothetical protein C0Q70_17993 [Pomacea canaliculata]|uniref:Protein kinase domain-containing protein n=1 Tax=Pomacea canaliculata TaxID=400727 RepID=A0A2T7NM00_POMCA|nr:hypothetical protein C0Q70_17993 [Pomacea canaliculata]